MVPISYWEHKKWNIDKAEAKVPQKYRMGNTCFTSVAVVGEKSYISHPQNMNHLHKD